MKSIESSMIALSISLSSYLTGNAKNLIESSQAIGAHKIEEKKVNISNVEKMTVATDEPEMKVKVIGTIVGIRDKSSGSQVDSHKNHKE